MTSDFFLMKCCNGFPIPKDSFKKYLLPDSQLVHRPVFEAAIRKISTGQALGLEERQVAEVLAVASTESASSGNEAEDFATRALLKRVCVGLKPFSLVEDEHTKKYTNLAPITVPTLKKYMDKVTKAVELKIAEQLPERFTLAIDGWTKGTTHFVAIFASYPHEDTYATALLTFTPLGRRAELHR